MKKTNHVTSDSYEYADEIFIMRAYYNAYCHAYHTCTSSDGEQWCAFWHTISRDRLSEQHGPRRLWQQSSPSWAAELRVPRL